MPFPQFDSYSCNLWKTEIIYPQYDIHEISRLCFLYVQRRKDFHYFLLYGTWSRHSVFVRPYLKVRHPDMILSKLHQIPTWLSRLGDMIKLWNAWRTAYDRQPTVHICNSTTELKYSLNSIQSNLTKFSVAHKTYAGITQKTALCQIVLAYTKVWSMEYRFTLNTLYLSTNKKII